MTGHSEIDFVQMCSWLFAQMASDHSGGIGMAVRMATHMLPPPAMVVRLTDVLKRTILQSAYYRALDYEPACLDQSPSKAMRVTSATA